MIGRNVQNDRHIGLEIVHTVELKRTEFQHIVIEIALGHLPRKTFADVACQTDVQAFVFQDEIGEHCGCSFAVGTGDTDFFGVRVSRSKLYFGDDGRTLCSQLLDNRSLFGDTGTFHHFVGIENQRLGVSVFLVRKTAFFEFGFIFRFQRTFVGQEHLVALFGCQNGRPDTAFTTAKNY